MSTETFNIIAFKTITTPYPKNYQKPNCQDVQHNAQNFLKRMAGWLVDSSSD